MASVTTIIEEVCEEMCQYYCKMPRLWEEENRTEKEGIELWDSDICNKDCPLNKLH